MLRVLWRIFGPNGVRNGEYCIMRMRWARYVARIGEMRNVHRALVRREQTSEDVGADGRIILECVMM
jgi:hypothetical protein